MHCENERLMRIKLKAKRDIVISNAYAHPADGYDILKKEEFFDEIKKFLRILGNRRVYFVVGGFNARLRCRRDGDGDAVGQHIFCPAEGRVQCCIEGS